MKESSEEEALPVVEHAAFPYSCEIEISLSKYAPVVKSILEVDKEISDRVQKSFQLCDSSGSGTTMDTLKITFESASLKMLRVSVSSFCEFLTVSLDVIQEFED